MTASRPRLQISKEAINPLRKIRPHVRRPTRRIKEALAKNLANVVPKVKQVSSSLEKKHQAYLQTLHMAAEAGIADIEAERFQGFDTSESLRRHLSALAKTCLTQRAPAANGN